MQIPFTLGVLKNWDSTVVQSCCAVYNSLSDYKLGVTSNDGLNNEGGVGSNKSR